MFEILHSVANDRDVVHHIMSFAREPYPMSGKEWSAEILNLRSARHTIYEYCVTHKELLWDLCKMSLNRCPCEYSPHMPHAVWSYHQLARHQGPSLGCRRLLTRSRHGPGVILFWYDHEEQYQRCHPLYRRGIFYPSPGDFCFDSLYCKLNPMI